MEMKPLTKLPSNNDIKEGDEGLLTPKMRRIPTGKQGAIEEEDELEQLADGRYRREFE